MKRSRRQRPEEEALGEGPGQDPGPRPKRRARRSPAETEGALPAISAFDKGIASKLILF